MPNRTLYDRDYNMLATASIEKSGDCYTGTVVIKDIPPAARWTFERYERLINDQVYSMLDVLENEITRMCIVSVSEDGVITELENVQLLPNAGTISFREGTQLTFPEL